MKWRFLRQPWTKPSNNWKIWSTITSNSPSNTLSRITYWRKPRTFQPSSSKKVRRSDFSWTIAMNASTSFSKKYRFSHPKLKAKMWPCRAWEQKIWNKNRKSVLWKKKIQIGKVPLRGRCNQELTIWHENWRWSKVSSTIAHWPKTRMKNKWR